MWGNHVCSSARDDVGILKVETAYLPHLRIHVPDVVQSVASAHDVAQRTDVVAVDVSRNHQFIVVGKAEVLKVQVQVSRPDIDDVFA